MRADNRTVATDALATLGTIINEHQKRDAIHLAVEPVIASERLSPGDHITVVGGIASACDTGAGLGIVDPFLGAPVSKGQRFWFVMYPRMVHSLRHVWTHPAFPDEAGTPAPAAPVSDTAPSESWLRQYAEEVGTAYKTLLEKADEWVTCGEYWTGGSEFEGLYLNPEFWVHYQIVTGKQVATEDQQNFFSCSC